MLKGFFREHLVKRLTRSPKWPKVRRAYFKDHPRCEICGRKFNRQVHHIIPFHIRPDLELDPDNLITLCGRHHFWWGHFEDWKNWNPEIINDVKWYKVKRAFKQYQSSLRREGC